MAAVDFCALQFEESPIYEGAPTTTPYRVSTEKLYLPIRSAQLAPNPALLDRADELRNITGAVPRIRDTFAPAGQIGVRGYINALLWLLELAGYKGTYTAGNGVITDPDSNVIPTGAGRWVFSKRTGIVPQTAQMKLNYANENALITGNGLAVSGLTLPASGEIAATLMGLVFAIAAADTTTSPSVTTQATHPIRTGNLYLSWLTSHGAIDASQFQLQIANPLTAIRSGTLDPPSDFPDLLEFGDQQVFITGSIPHRVLKQSDITALLNASTFSATARWKTDTVITGSTHHAVWCQMPACQYVGGQADNLANTRRRGHSFDFFAAYDESSSYDSRFTLVTDVTSIETYA